MPQSLPRTCDAPYPHSYRDRLYGLRPSAAAASDAATTVLEGPAPLPNPLPGPSSNSAPSRSNLTVPICLAAALVAAICATTRFSPIPVTYLWVLLALLGAGAQTFRNFAQRQLTHDLGAVGATYVRFIYGFPFVLGFLSLGMALTGAPLPEPPYQFWGWTLLAGLAQTIATVFMLIAMKDRAFSVITACVKTEPVFLAALSVPVLGERLSIPGYISIAIATGGVLLISLKSSKDLTAARSFLFGLGAAAIFAVTTLSFRGTITSLQAPEFIVSATFSLFVVMTIQCLLLLLYCVVADRRVLVNSLALWRPSLLAGAAGAFASGFLFIAYALTNAASVRTVTLVEVLFSQAITHFVLGQRTSLRELSGIAVIVIGVGLLLISH